MTERRHSPLEIKTTPAHMCTTTARLKILSRVPFFQNLTSSDIEWINSLFHEEGFKVDEIISYSGEPAERFFVVADGRVKLFRHSLAGKDILLDLLTPGEFFGAYSGQEDDVYSETALAQSPCCILVINRETFQQILKQLPTIAINVISIMAKRLKTSNDRVHQLSTLPVERRIASILMMLADKFGEKREIGLLLQVPLSRDDLAEMTSTTTESASRVMSQFQKDGLIRSGRGWVAVLDREGLEAIAGNELQ